MERWSSVSRAVTGWGRAQWAYRRLCKPPPTAAPEAAPQQDPHPTLHAFSSHTSSLSPPRALSQALPTHRPGGPTSPGSSLRPCSGAFSSTSNDPTLALRAPSSDGTPGPLAHLTKPSPTQVLTSATSQGSPPHDSLGSPRCNVPPCFLSPATDDTAPAVSMTPRSAVRSCSARRAPVPRPARRQGC